MIEQIFVFLYIFFSILLLPYGYNCFFLVYAANKYKMRENSSIENIPVVTVQLPLFNERYVASRLIQAVCAQNWPMKRLEVLVLDDSMDDTSVIIDQEVSAFRSKGFNIGVVRRSNRSGFKAGALQNALSVSHGKYIAVFDADFIPSSDFLNKAVPTLEADSSLGFVQARWGHVNRDYSKLTEAFALGIDGHHVIEQSGRSALGLLMNFNGSCGVLRTEAIIEAGGWSSDTLSEDLDLSYRMQLKGWKAHYLRDLAIPGEIPPNMPAFRNQQARWARGSIQCGRKLLKKVWSSSQLSFLQKTQATVHMTYYSIHLLMLMVLIVTVPLIIFEAFPLLPFFSSHVLVLGICAISSSNMYYESIKRQNLSLREKIPYLGLLYLIGYGLTAQCSISVIKGIVRYGGFFERTPKYDIQDKHDEWRDKIYKPFKRIPILEIILAAYSLIGIIYAFLTGLWPLMFYLFIYFAGYTLVAYYTTIHFKQSNFNNA